jgi:hypothetical protein
LAHHPQFPALFKSESIRKSFHAPDAAKHAMTRNRRLQPD